MPSFLNFSILSIFPTCDTTLLSPLLDLYYLSIRAIWSALFGYLPYYLLLGDNLPTLL